MYFCKCWIIVNKLLWSCDCELGTLLKPMMGINPSLRPLGLHPILEKRDLQVGLSWQLATLTIDGSLIDTKSKWWLNDSNNCSFAPVSACCAVRLQRLPLLVTSLPPCEQHNNRAHLACATSRQQRRRNKICKPHRSAGRRLALATNYMLVLSAIFRPSPHSN